MQSLIMNLDSEAQWVCSIKRAFEERKNLLSTIQGYGSYIFFRDDEARDLCHQLEVFEALRQYGGSCHFFHKKGFIFARMRELRVVTLQ